MRSRRIWVGRVARSVPVIAIVAGVAMVAAGLVANSAVMVLNGALLVVGVVLFVGVVYSAVFAREEQLNRRAASTRR
jgi:uncharacterized membrane protein YgdD (TMEM256/DUF423 family)